MRITAITATPLSATWAAVYGEQVPAHLAHPAASHAHFPRTGQHSVLVEIATEDGGRGVGECYGLPHPAPVASFIDHLLAPALIGADAFRTDVLWHRMMSLPRGTGLTRGVLMHAISGIDIALWDLKARALGLPLARLLGGDAGEPVECYASPVPYLDTPEESQDRARGFVERGFRALKLKVGRGVAVDAEHVAAVRDTIGPGVGLMLDCNCAYTVREAIQLMRAVEPAQPAWLEEPLAPDDHEGLAEVRRRATMPIATGENEFTVGGVRDIVTSRAADVLMPNLTRAGGITGTLRIARFAEAHGVEIAPHGVGSAIGIAAALHAMSVMPNALVFEYNQFPNPLRERLAPLPDFERGRLRAAPGPGLGVLPDASAVVRFAPSLPTPQRAGDPHHQEERSTQ